MTTRGTPFDAGQAEVHTRLVAIPSALVTMIRQHETAWTSVRPVDQHGNARAALSDREGQL